MLSDCSAFRKYRCGRGRPAYQGVGRALLHVGSWIYLAIVSSQPEVRTYAPEQYVAWAEELGDLMGAEWLASQSPHPHTSPTSSPRG
jgi:hypothetical protein